MKTRALPPALAVAAALLFAAADWPQFRGPARDDVSRDTGLLKRWPAGGPKLLWTFEGAGTGYSGPSVVGDRVYLMAGDGKNEFVQALDVQTGKKVWSGEVGPFYTIDHGSGPRGTPTVAGDAVVALGAEGDLACFDRSTGTKRWSVRLTGSDGLGGGLPHWGYSESPLVDGDRVVCSPGGSRGTLAALDKNSGKVLWRSTELTDPAAYSSVVPGQLAGVRQYVQQTMKGVAAVAPEDGRLLWYHPRAEYRVAVIPAPLVHEGLVYATAGYGAGECLLQPERADGKFTTRDLYAGARRVMDNKHGGVVAVGENVFGWSDSNRGEWICQDFRTGKKVWGSKALGRGSVTCADGMLYCYAEKDGTCVLVPASAAGWKEQGRFTIPRHPEHRELDNNVWTHPVVANGRLYLRDQDFLFCYDVKAAAR